MQKPLIKILLYFCATIILTSCELDADEDSFNFSDDYSRPIVYCVAEPNSPLEVFVYGSTSYSSNDSITIVDASVSVTWNNTNYTASLSDSAIHTVFNNIIPSSGDNLFLQVETLNQTITAETTVPTTVNIERLDTSSYQNNERLRFLLHMSDDPTTDDFYQATIARRTFQNGSSSDEEIECTYTNYFFQTATVSFGEQSECIGLFSDADASGSTYILNFSAAWTDLISQSESADSTKIIVRLYHHTADYYSFLQTSLQAQQYYLLSVFGSSDVSTNLHSSDNDCYGILGATAYDQKEFLIGPILNSDLTTQKN